MTLAASFWGPGARPARAFLGGVDEARARTSGRHVFLALLLAATLFVCHGLLGASHLLAHGDGPVRVAAPASSEPPHATEHSMAMGAISGTHHATGPTGHEGPPAGGAEYFAVLLALAGVALLASLSRHRRSQLLAPARRTVSVARALQLRPLPGGPSPPLLQVFRL